MKNRNYYIKIWRELASEKSMLFLTGPRQSGKTTLAQMLADSFANRLYFNWDIPEDKTRLIENPGFFETVERRDESRPFIVFDEIHKYRDWKNYLKGVYDRFHREYLFLVTGSGRLDLYRKGGDSLAGRYFLFHIWPFTIAELAGNNADFDSFIKDPLTINMKGQKNIRDIWSGLSTLSGFPEPFLSGKKTTYRRWSSTYSHQIIREDIRDMTDIKSIQEMETLYLLLPSKTGSPVSIPSLARDLKVSYNSVHNWLSVFERFFMIFSVYPWTKKISRAIQKERKVYIWDAPRISDEGALFENMAAIELYRAVTAWKDMGFGDFGLYFIKNKEQQEVDFLLTKDGSPFLLIEAKLSAQEPSESLRKFQSMLNVPAVQLVRDAGTFKKFTGREQPILTAPAAQWLSMLP